MILYKNSCDLHVSASFTRLFEQLPCPLARIAVYASTLIKFPLLPMQTLFQIFLHVAKSAAQQRCHVRSYQDCGSRALRA